MQPEDPRDRRIAELTALVESLTARVAELQAQVARLSRNSPNSSKPPSSDPPGIERPSPKRTGRKRGGQPGHAGSRRELLPPEQVDVIVPLVPRACDCCNGELHGRDPKPRRHQVTEVPPIKPIVTEYQLHSLECDECGAITCAELPIGVPTGDFGPRLMSMVAILTAKYRHSKRSAQDLLADFLGIKVSLGSISNIEQQVATALTAPVEEARAHVQQAAVVHADETSWREDKGKAWLWVATTKLVTVFMIAASRGACVAKDLLGQTFKGILTTDRWSGYVWVDAVRRQLCWSHLLRDFQSWVDEGGSGAPIGAAILKEARRMFRWWHRVRDGTLTRAQFAMRARSVQANISARLMEAEDCGTRRMRGMAKEMRKIESAMWTFIDTPGVEPTNNLAERQIRHAVLWRKGCFGTDSAAGSRFVERVLSTVMTLRQQKRNVLEFITAACTARLHDAAPPSLLPR